MAARKSQSISSPQKSQNTDAESEGLTLGLPHDRQVPRLTYRAAVGDGPEAGTERTIRRFQVFGSKKPARHIHHSIRSGTAIASRVPARLAHTVAAVINSAT